MQGWGWQGSLGAYSDAFRERTLANCQGRLSSTRTACLPFQLCPFSQALALGRVQ